MAQLTVTSGRKMPSVEQGREITIEDHLQDLHHGRDHADEADEGKEAEIDVRQSGPGKRVLLQDSVVDQIVDRHRNGLDDPHGDAQAEGRLDPLGDGQEHAHAEEERERHVLDEGRPHEEVEGFAHRGLSDTVEGWMR